MLSRRSFLLSLVTVPVVLAACGSDDKSSSTTAAAGTTAGGATTTGAATTAAATTTARPPTTHGRRTGAPRQHPRRQRTEKVTLRLGYFPNVTHAPALVGVEEGIFAKDARRQRHARDVDLQRRPGGDRGAVRRRDRRHLHRPEPGDQRLRQVRTARRSGSSPAPPRAAPSSSSSPTSPRAADLKGKTIATPAARQHPGRRPALLAEGPGPQDRHRSGGGDVSIMPQDNADTLDAFKPGRSTAPGCPSRGRPAWSRRAAARCSSTSSTCGRTASSSPPT